MRFKSILIINLVFFLSCVSQPAQKFMKEDLSITRKGATVLVVVHSRSGNTARAGLAFAGALQADYLRLAVPEGAGDSYLKAPDRGKDAPITPERVDVSRYRLVFLGSPIWWYYPAPFIYTFIRKNDFTGKRVVLFYTYQGGINKGAVEEWKKLVASKNGRVVDVIGINRGELKNETVDSAALKIIADKKSLWLKD
jgi:flavodoxin